MSIQRQILDEDSPYVGTPNPDKRDEFAAGDEVVIVRDRFGEYIYDANSWEIIHSYRCPATGLSEDPEKKRLSLFSRLSLVTGSLTSGLLVASIVFGVAVVSTFLVSTEGSFGGAEPPTVVPATIVPTYARPAFDPQPTQPDPTLTPQPRLVVYEEVADAALAYTEAYSALLTDYDISGLADTAIDDAFADRVAAWETIQSVNDCYWQYEDEGFYVLSSRLLSQELAEVYIQIDRSGRVFCPFGSPNPQEFPQFAFDGPVFAVYGLIRQNERWVVYEARLLGEALPPLDICECAPLITPFPFPTATLTPTATFVGPQP